MTTIDQIPPRARSGAAGSPGGRGQPHFELSHRLTEPLRIVDKRARALAWLKALAQLAALVAVVCLLMVLFLGWRVRVPLWIGIPVTLAGWAAVVYGGYRILKPLFVRKRGLASAALLVDRSMPDTEERLSSAVELSQETDPRFRGSPELVACLIRQAEHHADTLDPGTVISMKDVRRWLSTVGGVLLIWFLLFVALTPNMLLGLQRMFAPWTAAAALPAPIIDVDPGDAVLAQGERLEIKVTVKPPAGLSLDNGYDDAAVPSLTQHFTAAGGVSPDITTRMERTGPREFRAIFQSVQQSFTYRVETGERSSQGIGAGRSSDFTVTVHTRPAIANVEVFYTYPPYTRLGSRTEFSREGAIDAVIGTRARVTLHATEAVETATLELEDDGTGSKKTITLERVADAATGNGMGQAAYAGVIEVNKNTSYRVKLLKADGKDNPDTQARPITARVDAAPVIGITNPDPTVPALKVRPDDTAAIRFSATDDFGINKVEAIIDIDGASAGTFDVPLLGDGGIAGDPRITGEWPLKLADILKNHLGTPKQVGFRFRATDTRDPNPQSTTTARQYLDLDKNASPLANRSETEAARELASAIEKAKDQLHEARERLDELQKSDTGRTLSPEDARRLADAQKNLAEARQQLLEVADKTNGTRLSEAGQLLKQIAETDVKKAADDAVNAGLASDQPAARRESEASSARNTQEAINKLTDLSNAIRNVTRHQSLAEQLERLAEEQRQLAEALAKNPDDSALLERQKELQRDLEKLIKENPDLQKPAADAAQGKVNELANRVRELENAQQPHREQAQAAKDAAAAAEKARDLARRQEALNRDIQDFANRQSETLRTTNAPRPPEQQKLDSIVKDLEGQKLEEAAKEQRATADALEKAEQSLQSIRRENEQNPARQRADKDAADARAAQEKANDLARQIQQARDDRNPPTRRSDPANMQAAELADQIKQQAQQMASNAGSNTAQRNAAQAAARAADAAKAAAQNGQADRAQQELSNAANQLAQSAQAQQQAAGSSPAAANAPDTQGAARQAGQLADKQRDLANEASRLARAKEEAQRAQENAAGNARQQRELADQMGSAAREAQQFAQSTQGSAPQLSEKAAQAAKALEQASQAQREAAQATGNRDMNRSSTAQERAADQLGAAEEALTGQRSNARGNNGQNNPRGDGEDNGQTAGQPNGIGNSPGGSQPGGSGGNAPGAGQPGGNGGSQAQGGSGGPPGNGGQATSGSSGGSAPGGGGGGGGGGSGNGPAQLVQGARTNQSQAAGGESAAARRAADQLAEAARQLTPPTLPGGRGGNGPGGTGGAPGDSGNGVTLTNNGRPLLPPQEVQEVGISPSDWARLPPEMQDQLIHAARQPGPPGYREMIKNYYSRISRLSAPSGGGGSQ